MKKTLIAVITFVLSLTSCEKTFFVNKEQQSDFVNVKLSLGKDYVSISSEPMTKSVGKLYYAFQIDSINIKEVHEAKNSIRIDTTYCHYADGVFTDIDNLSVNLEKGHKYYIRCQVVKNGRDELYIEDGYVYEPFVADEYGKGTKAFVGNAFVYGQNQEVYPGCTYWTKVNDNENKLNAEVDMYYGETEFYVSDNTSISIDMDRKNSALHFYIVPPKEGTLKVYQIYGNPKFEYILNSDSKIIDETRIFCCLINEITNIYLKVEWTKADESVIDLSPEPFKAYNKNIYNINIDVNDRIGGSDIDINMDSSMTTSNDEIQIR